MSQPERDALIKDLAALIQGLCVPISLEVPIGAALAPWSAIHTRLIGVGWATAAQYEAALREVLDAPEVSPGHDGTGPA